MKRTLLTAISVIALISLAQGQASQPTHGLQINTNGLKHKDESQTKSSTGAATPGRGGMPSGGGTSNTPNSGGGKAGSMGGGNSTTTSSTPSSGGGKAGSMGGGSTSTTQSSGGTNVSTSDASSALTQLLSAGINAAVSKVSVTDGYFGNPDIKIPLPPEMQQVGTILTTYGAGALVDKLVMQLNRSAEQSATLATPIFLNAITQITPSDAVNIITGQQQDAATQFLKRTTTEQLVVAFKPKVQSVLDQTKTSEAYADVINLYNKIPFVSHPSADLPDFVTRKALDGLFVMVGKEEAKIRQNPAATGSSILSKVLGAVLGQSSLRANQGVKAGR